MPFTVFRYNPLLVDGLFDERHVHGNEVVIVARLFNLPHLLGLAQRLARTRVEQRNFVAQQPRQQLAVFRLNGVGIIEHNAGQKLTQSIGCMAQACVLRKVLRVVTHAHRLLRVVQQHRMDVVLQEPVLPQHLVCHVGQHPCFCVLERTAMGRHFRRYFSGVDVLAIDDIMPRALCCVVAHFSLIHQHVQELVFAFVERLQVIHAREVISQLVQRRERLLNVLIQVCQIRLDCSRKLALAVDIVGQLLLLFRVGVYLLEYAMHALLPSVNIRA